MPSTGTVSPRLRGHEANEISPISTEISLQGWTGMCSTQFGKVIAYTSFVSGPEEEGGWHSQISASPFSYRLKLPTKNV